MAILSIRKETYFRLDRLAQAKNLNVDSLVSGFLDNAERDHEEMVKIISILDQVSPARTGIGGNVNKDNVIYGLQFTDEKSEVQ